MAEEHAHRARSVAADLAFALLGALVALLMVPSVARAYVDPSAVTYTIQAIAGVAVALGAVLGVFLRRSRRVIFKIFHIDENANKTVDPEVHRVEATDEAARSEADERARGIRREISEGRPAKRLGWPTRFLRALLAVTFLVFTVFVFGPLEVVAGSSESLLFGFYDVTFVVVLMGVILTLVLALVLSLVRGRAFDVALALVVAVGVCCYVQALFLNVSLPTADGQQITLFDHKRILVIDTIVWAAIISAFLVFNAKRTASCRALVLVLSAALLVVQGVGVVSIAGEERAKLDEEIAQFGGTVAMSTYGLDEVGAEGNVTVFILDMFDTRVLEEAVADDPHLLDEYTGFTWYQNSTGMLIPTGYALPYLATGVAPEPGDDYQEYLDTRYDRSTLFPDILDQGYEITAYSDSLDKAKLEPYAANLHATESHKVDTEALWPLLAKVGLYRDGPWLLKPLVWFYTDQLNATAEDNYVMDDIVYAENLREDGLHFSESADKTFRFIHLLGDHWPYIMDKDGNRVLETENSQVAQAEGAILIVADYLRELKRLGIYDQSTVIVTSDHGEWYVTLDPLDHPVSPILLVKPAETAEEAAEPLKVSDVPTGHVDLPATFIEAVGGDASAYGTPVWDVEEGPRERVYWMTRYGGGDDWRSWNQYVIDGDVLDFENWHLTGEEIDFHPQS